MIRGGDRYKAAHRRRAESYGVGGVFDQGDVMIRLARQGERCHYCGEVLELTGRRKFQVDHFIPLARGGRNSMSNIVCACPECNRDKGVKMPWEYRPARFDVGCRRD